MWRLPETVVRVVGNCSPYDEDSPGSIVNCVRLVNALAKELGVYVGHVDALSVADTIRAGQDLLALTKRILPLYVATATLETFSLAEAKVVTVVVSLNAMRVGLTTHVVTLTSTLFTLMGAVV